MLTIPLDPETEQRLRQLAESLGQEASALAGRVLEEYLDLHAWTDDSAEQCAEASIAMTPEVIGNESWDEGDGRV